MTARIGSNIPSLSAQRILAETSSVLSKTFERLSTGQRINRASDDPAGLAVAGQLRADSRVFTQSIRNVNDGISYLNIADGALSELSNITARQLELAQQAANGVYSSTQRKALNAEANALVQEFNRIVQSTEFNGRKIVDTAQSGGALRIQAGYGAEGGVAFEIAQDLARTVGSGEFSQKISYTEGAIETAAGTALADLNGDGAADLVMSGAGGGAGKVTVQFNDGQGNFGAATAYGMDGIGSLALSLSDMNGDGAVDLVTSGGDGPSATVTVRLNNGSGSFGAAVSYALGSGCAYALSIGDLNGDGFADIAAAGFIAGGGKAWVALSNGSGSFSSPISYAQQFYGAYAVTLADLDGDGALDMITAGYGDNWYGEATVRFNDGQGNFGAAIAYEAETSTSLSVAACDVNGDGSADLITAGTDSQGRGKVTIRLNDGVGHFGASVTYDTGNAGNWAVKAEDINGDGARDLVTSGWDMEGTLSASLNDGRGTFSAFAVYTTDPYSSYSAAVADIDGDGATDIVTGGADFVSQAVASVFKALPEEVSTIAALDLFTQDPARAALTVIQAQLDRIGAERGEVGSAQSRLSAALNTLYSTCENVDRAEARITDADIAEESARMVRLQILTQAGTAVLAQANQQPALVLSLFGISS